MGYYKELYEQSIRDPENFWRIQSETIRWFQKPESILSKDEDQLFQWFKGGKLNTCYLALDYHIEQGNGDVDALIYDSPVTNQVRRYTYYELREEVARFAGVLKSFSIRKGDTVIIHMPMIPEAVIAMLACARIGAIHCVVFGGFAPHELAMRIDDAEPKLIVSASYGIEIHKMIPYKPILDEAIHLANHKPSNVIVYQRPNIEEIMHIGRDHYWHTLIAEAEPIDYIELDATDPLYILYTPDSTGKPQGVVRDNGGHAVAMKLSMQTVYNAKAGDVFWAASDLGWIVGHSYIVYAPLLQGCTTILYEGKPVKTPDPGVFWGIIEEYRVSVLLTSPSVFRMIRSEDPEGKFRKMYDLSSLNYLFLTGERTDLRIYDWLKDLLKVPIIDHWWQTETGYPICSNPMGVSQMVVKEGSVTMPMFGFDIKIFDEEGLEANRNQIGNIVLHLPLPPGCISTLWNDAANYRNSYLNKYKGYYLTNDAGYMDEDGYVFVIGRTDDVINVAGHRISTGEMEEILYSHPAVVECAVIGIEDSIKGQVPVGFIVTNDGRYGNSDELERELTHLIREEIGAIATLKKAILVKHLPKSRSGKILRKTLSKIASGEESSIAATLDDSIVSGR